uniref:Uncharacterized protein n=1 Tax=Panagrolaimus superbus TaxID=310955 RepID=A0A914YHF3_9BILA
MEIKSTTSSSLSADSGGALLLSDNTDKNDNDVDDKNALQHKSLGTLSFKPKKPRKTGGKGKKNSKHKPKPKKHCGFGGCCELGYDRCGKCRNWGDPVFFGQDLTPCEFDPSQNENNVDYKDDDYKEDNDKDKYNNFDD